MSEFWERETWGIPERIVCLTEEFTEILYLLGEEDRIVGISAYTVRPPEAKRDKEVVSAFIGGSVKKIKALEPDLVLGFSDIQAQLAHDLIKENLSVLIFNQRSLGEILDVIVQVGALVGRRRSAEELARGYAERLREVARESAGEGRRRVYFEEWDEPRITAIQWVGELIEIAGGENVFADRSCGKLAKERFVDDEEIQAADPEVIIGCWCGKEVDLQSIRDRPGYGELQAVRQGKVFEMDPAIILQPGPAALTDGLDKLVELISGE